MVGVQVEKPRLVLTESYYHDAQELPSGKKRGKERKKGFYHLLSLATQPTPLYIQGQSGNLPLLQV